MKQKNENWLEQLLSKFEKSGYTIIAIAAVWCLLAYLLFDFKGMLAVIITLIAVAVFAFVKSLSAKKPVALSDGKVAALEAQLRSLKAELKGAQASCAALEAKVQTIEQQSTLDYKYSKTLVCLQRIDDMFRNLDANIASPNFERNVRMAMDEVLFSYGYRFADYAEQNKQLYDCEYQPIEAPEVIFRAITRADGTLAVKGKVFLPLE